MLKKDVNIGLIVKAKTSIEAFVNENQMIIVNNKTLPYIISMAEKFEMVSFRYHPETKTGEEVFLGNIPIEIKPKMKKLYKTGRFGINAYDTKGNGLATHTPFFVSKMEYVKENRTIQ